MKKTILITGASSGIGKDTAKYFQSKGWNVIATMRSPENENELTKLDNVLVTKLDVLDLDSIDSAIANGIQRFGKIDVLLNNAGYGAYGPLESFIGCKVKIVEPGAIATDFAGRSFDFNHNENLKEYQNVVNKIMTVFPTMIKSASPVNIVSKVIFKAATDGKSKLRYMAGKDAKMYNFMNKVFGYNFIVYMNKKFFKL